MKSPSIQEKWGELIKPEEERDFVLPFEYQELLSAFNQLDSTLNFFLGKEIPLFLNDILNSLEKTLRKYDSRKYDLFMYFIGELL